KGCSFTPEVLREVQELPHLTHLNLESSTVTGEHLKALTLPGLSVLSVWGTSVTAADLIEFRRRHAVVGFDGISHLGDEVQRLQKGAKTAWPGASGGEDFALLFN